jgi:hypothetical protein
MKIKNIIDNMAIVIVKNILEVIKVINVIIVTGKAKNIIKFIITLVFKININKYSLNVVANVAIDNFIDLAKEAKTPLFSITIIYLE